MLAGQCSVPWFLYRAYSRFFFQTPERAKNIDMSQQGDVENEMPLDEEQDNSEL